MGQVLFLSFSQRRKLSLNYVSELAAPKQKICKRLKPSPVGPPSPQRSLSFAQLALGCKQMAVVHGQAPQPPYTLAACVSVSLHRMLPLLLKPQKLRSLKRDNQQHTQSIPLGCSPLLFTFGPKSQSRSSRTSIPWREP
jgi:hypothetical protein